MPSDESKQDAAVIEELLGGTAGVEDTKNKQWQEKLASIHDDKARKRVANIAAQPGLLPIDITHPDRHRLEDFVLTGTLPDGGFDDRRLEVWALNLPPDLGGKEVRKQGRAAGKIEEAVFTRTADGKYAQQVWHNDRDEFAVFNPKDRTVSYEPLVWKTPPGSALDIAVTPHKTNEALREKLRFPTGVEEYGTFGALVDKAVKWALKQFDPGPGKQDEFIWHIIDFITGTWCNEIWTKDGERYVCMNGARGETGSGKKRYTTIAHFLCYLGWRMTAKNAIPSLYRGMARWPNATLLVDEAGGFDIRRGSDTLIYLLCRVDGTVYPVLNPVTMLPEDFIVFGKTVYNMTDAWNNDALASRCHVFITAPTNLPDADEPDLAASDPAWVEEGHHLTNQLLCWRFDMLHLIDTGVIKPPRQVRFPHADVRDSRIRESMLLPDALIPGDEVELRLLMNRMVKTFDEQQVQEKSLSYEGRVVNAVYNALMTTYKVLYLPAERGWVLYQDKILENASGQILTPIPLCTHDIEQLTGIGYIAVHRVWTLFGQQVLPRKMLPAGDRQHYGLLLITDAKRLDQTFRSYVVGAESRAKDFVKPGGVP